MVLRFARDSSPADWLTRSGEPWWQLVTLGPSGFPAYGRLRFIPDPVDPRQSENDVVLPDGHPADLEQAGRALAVLQAFTTTPDSCYFCVWEGSRGLPFPSETAARPWVEVPHRRYALLEGRLRDIDQWQTVLDDGSPPAFVWPADRSWVFACDVDPHWAGIAASEPALHALLHESALDVVPADPRRPQPCFGPPSEHHDTASSDDDDSSATPGSRWGSVTDLSP